MPTTTAAPHQSPNPPSHPSSTQAAINKLVSEASHLQQLLGRSKRLHVFLEADDDSPATDYAFNSSTKTHVLFSPTVMFTAPYLHATQQLVSALAVYAVPRDLLPVPSSSLPPVINVPPPPATSVPISPSPSTPSLTPSTPTPTPTLISNPTACATHHLHVSTTAPLVSSLPTSPSVNITPNWFPGSERVEPDETLLVKPQFVELFANLSKTGLAYAYQSTFNTWYHRIKRSTPGAELIAAKKWNGTFSFRDFTPPWIKKQIAMTNNALYINLTDRVVLPHPRSLRNALGLSRMARILAGFYEHEPFCKDLLDKLLSSIPFYMWQPTQPLKEVRKSSIGAEKTGGTSGTQIHADQSNQHLDHMQKRAKTGHLYADSFDQSGETSMIVEAEHQRKVTEHQSQHDPPQQDDRHQNHEHFLDHAQRQKRLQHPLEKQTQLDDAEQMPHQVKDNPTASVPNT